MNTAKPKITNEQQNDLIESYGLIFNFMQSAMIAASVSIERDKIDNAQEWLLNTLEGVDLAYWPKKDEDLDTWAKDFQEGKNFSCEFDKLKARNNDLFSALEGLLKAVQTTKQTQDYCAVEQAIAESALRATHSNKVTDFITRDQMNQKVIEAVAGARKAWAAQGCPEVKGLHGAEVITGLLDSMIGALEAGYVDSNSPTLADLYQTARNHLKDNYGIDIPNIVDKYDQEIAEMCGFKQ